MPGIGGFVLVPVCLPVVPLVGRVGVLVPPVGIICHCKLLIIESTYS